MNSEFVEVEQTEIPKTVPPEPCIVVIFGVTGDLTHRELIPSLYALNCKGLLPKPFAITKICIPKSISPKSHKTKKQQS